MEWRLCSVVEAKNAEQSNKFRIRSKRWKSQVDALCEATLVTSQSNSNKSEQDFGFIKKCRHKPLSIILKSPYYFLKKKKVIRRTTTTTTFTKIDTGTN